MSNSPLPTEKINEDELVSPSSSSTPAAVNNAVQHHDEITVQTMTAPICVHNMHTNTNTATASSSSSSSSSSLSSSSPSPSPSLHLLPLRIAHTGPSKVQVYFQPHLSELSHEYLEATFRGRGIIGQHIQLQPKQQAHSASTASTASATSSSSSLEKQIFVFAECTNEESQVMKQKQLEERDRKRSRIDLTSASHDSQTTKEKNEVITIDDHEGTNHTDKKKHTSHSHADDDDDDEIRELLQSSSSSSSSQVVEKAVIHDSDDDDVVNLDELDEHIEIHSTPKRAKLQSETAAASSSQEGSQEADPQLQDENLKHWKCIGTSSTFVLWNPDRETFERKQLLDTIQEWPIIAAAIHS